MYFAPSESTFATTDANEGRPSEPLKKPMSYKRLQWSSRYLRSRVDGITTHNHCGVLRVRQERHRSWIRDGVDTTQLDVDLKTDVREVLRLGLFAFMALQALGCYSSLRRAVSQIKDEQRYSLT